ncbi:MAG: hypothetical protein M1469_02530 [Bacteroidetes bacterium]|nr:hypothetical protein [Bacteroidota bacterium]
MEKRDLRVIGDGQFELWAFTEDLQYYISVSILVFKNMEVIGYVWIRPNLHRAIFSSIQRLQESLGNG